MADPGGGAKFVPANLNRSYGRQQSKASSGNPAGALYGPGWARPGGGGGSMMVLSRSHSLQKAAGSKLSVPPPLNLPSRRKEEHRGFDSSGSTSGVVAPARGGSRPGSSGVGWTKPAAVVALEEGLGDNVVVDPKGTTGPVVGSAYVPPSARIASSAPSQGYSAVPLVEKATVLRGEDFPSLKAALPSANSGLEKKHKEGAVQKQKLARIEEMPTGLRDGSTSSVLLDMRPHIESKGSIRNYGRHEDGKQNRVSLVGVERNGKQEDYSPAMLPWVHMSPRSDWEDDERDTGHTLVADRGRHQGYSRSEAYWESDFNFPRSSNFPQKPMHNLFERSGFPANDTARMSPRDIKADTSGKHVATPGRDGREGNSWKAPSSLSKEGHSIHEAGNERDVSSARPSGKKNRELDKLPLAFQDHSRDESGSRGNAFYNQGGKQPWNNKMDPFVGRGLERNSRGHYGNEQLNRHQGEHFQNNFGLRSSSSSSGGKVVAVYDPVMNFGRDKRISSKSGKHYAEDPVVKDMWMSDFDGSDHFSVGLVGLVKKKKEVLKQTEFHDPVRESFEAELERVQKMQEIERQRNLEEKERVMELPRREEEERMRLAREQEEQRRRLEEEAQEVAWRAEQQRLEAMQKAEEQRLAREEAKHKTLMEEERRKEAARQKLLELEEKIANRKAEAASSATSSSGFTDEKPSGMALKKDVLKVPDSGEWEDGERMAERITTSASPDSLMINRPSEIGSKHGPIAVLDRGKAMGSWKNDALDMGNRASLFQQYQENPFNSPKWDASDGGRLFPRRKYQGGPGLMSLGASQKEGSSDSLVDELGQSKSRGWNISWEGERYSRTLDMELRENIEDDRYIDPGWGQNHPGENVYPPHRERMHHNPEDEGMYSFGRSRYSTRQPRVLPPPSFSSIHRIPVRSEHKHPGPSTFVPNEMLNNHGAGNEPTTQTKLDDSLWESSLEAGVVDAQYQGTRFEGQKLDGGSARCDSASSFSVSSPPGTPAHLSHDDSEESRDSPVLSANGNIDDEGKDCVVLPSEAVNANVLHAGVVSTAEEEDEEEEWSVDNNVELQQQEEYDEDGSYEEEVDGKDENVKLVHEFDGEMFEGHESPDVDNSVLCFNEGVEVKMPNDEFEICSRNLHSVDGSAPTSNDFSIEHEAAATQMSTTMEPPSQSVPESSVLPNQSQIPSLSIDAVQGTAISVPTQPEVPLNLQFGLFSGPPLIPSPVQAIQIGSIQTPLHLHPPIGPSFGNKHQLQPTLFHFGQLRYTSPISPEILPLAPQSGNFSLNKGNMSISNDTESKSGTVIPPRESANDSTKLRHSSRDLSHVDESRSTPEVGIQVEDSCMNNLKTSIATVSTDEWVFGSVPSRLVPNRGNFGMSKSQGPSSGGRGRRYVTAAKFGSRSLLPTPDASHPDSGEFHRRSRRQRTEFRVRENPQREGHLASQRTYSYGRQHTYSYEVNDRSSNIGRGGGARSTIRHMPNRQAKQTSQSQGSSWRPVTLLGKDTKVCEKESSRNTRNLPFSGEHAETSWQGGIGSDFKKPDVETPGDDDFIEVRSRRQMLIERQAQREKEIKAKSRVPKIPRKLHPTSQAVVGCARSNKAPAVSTVSNNFSSDCVTAERRSLIRALETSAGTKSPSVSQPLPPIGTPTVKNGINAKADKSSQQTRSVQTSSLVSNGGKSLTPESVYDSGDKLHDDVQISAGCLGNSRITQQVMALTQTQLDEAMQPAHFDSCPAVGDSKNKAGEPSQPPASTLNKDKSSSSGKKIQFGLQLKVAALFFLKKSKMSVDLACLCKIVKLRQKLPLLLL